MSTTKPSFTAIETNELANQPQIEKSKLERKSSLSNNANKLGTQNEEKGKSINTVTSYYKKLDKIYAFTVSKTEKF